MGVVTAKLGTPIGRFNVEAAGSNPDQGASGKAAKLTWRSQRNNQIQRNQPSLSFGVSYKSKHFRGLFDDPVFNEEARRFDIAYSQNLFNGFSLGLSSSHTQNRTVDDTNRHTLSLGRSFNGWSLGSSISYLEEGDDNSWEAQVTASYDFGKRTRIRARQEWDSDGDRVTAVNLSSAYSEGIRLGNGTLDYSIGVSANEEGDGSLSGSLDYTGNRFEFSANHSTDIDSLTDGNLDGQRTTLRGGIALAFAEGQFAVGRPIRDSFAIFTPHETIADKKLLIGNRNKRGVYSVQSDGFGALLMNINSGARQVSSVRFDVDDLPLGYDLGTGLTNLSARYKSGFGVTVGSAYNVIATATLFDKYDRPAKLLLGKATEFGKADGRTADAFTDGEGRLSVSGVSPGRWQLEMFAKKPLNYILNVPQGRTGIVELGTLKPVSKSQ